MMPQSGRNIVLILAGGLLSIAGGNILRNSSGLLSIGLLFLGIGLIIYASGAGVEARSASTLRGRNKRTNSWNDPIVAVLNDMGWPTNYPDVTACTDVSPSQWVDRIEYWAYTDRQEVSTRYSYVDESWDKYCLVLNPYGGVYPESNLNELSTINKILRYVGRGGIFANVADIPSYWAYDPKLGRRLEAGNAVYNQGQRNYPFLEAPLLSHLDISIYGVVGPQDGGSSHTLNPTYLFSRYFNESLRPLVVTRVFQHKRNTVPILETVTEIIGQDIAPG